MAWADAAVGADAAIQRLLLQRLAEQHYADQQRQQQFENTRQLAGDERANRQLDQQGEFTKLQREAQAANIQSEIEARKTSAEESDKKTTMDALDRLVPPGSQLASDNPLYQAGQKYGYLRTASVVQPGGMGADFQGPMPTGEAPEAVANNNPRIITTGATFGQQEKLTADQEKQDGLKRQQEKDAADAAYRDKELALRERALNKPDKEPTAHFSVQQTYDENGKPNGLVRINTLTGEVTPTDGGNIKPPPGAAQDAQTAKAKTEALGSLDQLDQAIEAAKDLIGPGAGRVSSIQQMVGNPDPRISALGTKMLLAKMQVDHAAAGTVRAAASPSILSRWDNILGNNQTPEGLKASVQAMREILGGGTAAPTATRKRYNPATGTVE